MGASIVTYASDVRASVRARHSTAKGVRDADVLRSVFALSEP